MEIKYVLKSSVYNQSSAVDGKIGVFLSNWLIEILGNIANDVTIVQAKEKKLYEIQFKMSVHTVVP